MPKIIRIIELLIPPIFMWGYCKLFKKNVRRAEKTFVGKYENFDEMHAHLKSETNYYWPEAIEQEFNTQKRLITAWNSEYPPSGTFRTNFLPTVLALFPLGSVRVLDIGGGLNNVFEYMKFSLKEKRIHVTVFDQLLAVQNGNKLYGHIPNLTFVDILPKDKDLFDVIYFGSSIQYFQDYCELFIKVANLNPKLIVITDSSFSVAKTFACAQVNMPGVTIPYMVINKVEMEDLARNFGYELIYQSTNTDLTNNFDSYEYPANLTRSWNLIFKKVTKTTSRQESEKERIRHISHS
jgi:putative methyltransferase (TIGR04325 family)